LWIASAPCTEDHVGLHCSILERPIAMACEGSAKAPRQQGTGRPGYGRAEGMHVLPLFLGLRQNLWGDGGGGMNRNCPSGIQNNKASPRPEREVLYCAGGTGGSVVSGSADSHWVSREGDHFCRNHRGIEQQSETDHEKIVRISNLQGHRNGPISKPRRPARAKLRPRILVRRPFFRALAAPNGRRPGARPYRSVPARAGGRCLPPRGTADEIDSPAAGSVGLAHPRVVAP